MKLSMIVAVDREGGIGRADNLPWQGHLPRDMAWFVKHTTGKAVLMGRKTFESIGKPLPNRTNIVISKKGFIAEGVITISSLWELQKVVGSDEEVVVIGGGQIYSLLLPFCDVLYYSRINYSFPNVDTFFPEKPTKDKWWLQEYRWCNRDSKNLFDCEFHIYKRTPPDTLPIEQVKPLPSLPNNVVNFHDSGRIDCVLPDVSNVFPIWQHTHLIREENKTPYVGAMCGKG